jgi:hypothetical protein
MLRAPWLALALAVSTFAQDRTASTRAPAWRELGLGAELRWIDDPEAHVDGARPDRPLRVAADRNALIDRAIARAKEQRRLVLWFVPRISEGQNRGRQMYRAPILEGYVMQLLFEDPDLVALAESRFVCARVNLDETLAARFDLRPLDFVEPALVFLDGEGKLVHFVERIRSFDAHWFVELMRRVLAHARLDGGDETVTDPREALDQGRYARAKELIDGVEDPGEEQYLRAILHRRLREPQKALAALEAAAGHRTVAAGLLDAERCRVLLLAGRDAELPDEPATDSARAPEAAYLRALAALRRGDENDARRRFEAVAGTWGDSPFGRRAAMNLKLGDDERPCGAAFSGFETLRWLDASAYAGLPRDTTWQGPARSAEDQAVAALEHLLQLQREDGGWKDSRYAYWPSPKITPNAWIAITALAATALLEHRETAPTRIPVARIDAALARAESYMFDPEHLARGENEDVYADTYRLLYLTRKHAGADPEARRALIDRMNAIVKEAGQRQHDDGFFAHEYANAFCTAAMLWGLLRARETGAEVADEMFSRGVGALLAARKPDGAFVYGGAARGEGGSSLKDASARMPVCEGVLYALGHSDAQRVRFAFDTYWANITRIEKVRRNDFHSDGELAGFFFFHALFHASEIWARLPEDLRGDSHAKFVALMARIPEADGSYIDSHEIGRSYATAMALLVLANLRR